jgi:glycosyltransferase involved in cell wall biosynthesis
VSLRAAACLFVRDEERDIAEWLAFQIAVGFDCCIVYDNGSLDRTPEIVRAFGKKYDVRLIDWPNTKKNRATGLLSRLPAHLRERI